MEEIIRQFSDELNLHYVEQEKIRDMISRHGGVNWKDALGHSQVISKLALVEELKSIIKPENTVVIVGGWIGLIPYLMQNQKIKCSQVINIEIDQVALAASDFLNSDSDFKYDVIFEDALNIDYKIWKELLVINTSCEHFSDYDTWIDKIPQGTTCILQSNNMFGLGEHVNCHKDLNEFEQKSGIKVKLKKEIDIGDSWKRFMLRGLR